MKQSRNIVVLPGIEWQVPLVKKIREMGHKSIVISPRHDSPAFKYANEFIIADIFNSSKYLPLLEQERIDAVISDECDIATEQVAILADYFAVPSQTIAIAQLYTDKVKMRKFLCENNLPYPAFRVCYSIEEAVDFFMTHGKKIIIKPIDSNSSHGVFTIHSVDELRNRFEESVSYSRKEKAIICEQYIYGTEFTVDGVKTPKGHTSLIVSEKKHYTHNKNVAYELFFSHTNPNFDYEKLRRINDHFVNISGLPFGLTHAEYKYDNGEFYLIEIGARGGGNLISSLIVPCLSGYDNYEALIKMALGESNIRKPSIAPDLANRCAVLEFFDAPGQGGIVKDIKGEEFLEKNPNILSYKLNFSVGDSIKPAICDTARIGFYIAYADSRDELLQLMAEIKNRVKFII